MSKQFYFKQVSLVQVHSLNVKIVLFQTIQFSISTQFSSIWLIDATTLRQSEPGYDGNKGVVYIPQNSCITGVLPSDCLGSYPGHLLGVRSLTPLQRSSRYIMQPQLTASKGRYALKQKKPNQTKTLYSPS